jgi:CRISPR/Cas system-associated protein Cas10 (large subunit of type III CRISPR-Cas system)
MLDSSRLHDIPADTRSPINDVSLWDHLKLTAAFAACIWLDGGYRGDNVDKYDFALISGDADRISRFVDQSSRLPDLNARSGKIRLATEAAGESVAESLGPECLIFSGGGGLLAISPLRMANKVAEEVKNVFESATQGLVTITVSSLKSNGNETQKGFGKVWKDAQWTMQQKKSERSPVTFGNLSEEVAPCDVCHVRASAHEDPAKTLPYDASPRQERLCELCWQLRKEGHGASLDQFKGQSNLVAVLKADGDSIGKVLGGDKFDEFGKAATPSRLSAISRHIHSVCENTLEKIVSDAGGRCLITGGDDILAVASGGESLKMAQRVAFEFKKEMANVCTMSAGVAIFRYDLPIYAGLEAADTLLHTAKENRSKDCVAFAMIGGVGLTPEELKGVRPRKWNELEEILRLSEDMGERGFASTQLRKIAIAAKKDPEYAEILIKNLMGRGEKGMGVGWGQGEELLFHMKSGILLDAFAVYNTFKT